MASINYKPPCDICTSHPNSSSSYPSLKRWSSPCNSAMASNSFTLQGSCVGSTGESEGSTLSVVVGVAVVVGEGVVGLGFLVGFGGVGSGPVPAPKNV